MKRLLLSLFLLVGLSMPSSVHASSEDSCGFGFVLSPGDTRYGIADTCDKSTWWWFTDNDGFTSFISVLMDADVTSYEEDIEVTTTMQISCQKRQLAVSVFTDPLDMYPDTNLRNVGTAQVRIDSKKVQTFSYVTMSDYSGVAFLSPKQLTTAILSAKSKVRIKIGTMNGYNVSAFAKSDLGAYSNKFKKKGCALK
jgi:hypothetical protein